jgi:hypothetical protein
MNAPHKRIQWRTAATAAPCVPTKISRRLIAAVTLAHALVLAGFGGFGAASAARAADAAPDAKPRDITFDTVKFEMKDPKSRKFQRSMLTEGIEKLDGHNVRVRGFMLNSFKTKGITQFVLVRDNKECCFGPGAALYDCIVVLMAEGKSAEFSVRPVTVEGTFTIRELVGPDGKHLSVYQLRGASVE